jgi:hypothetical protein
VVPQISKEDEIAGATDNVERLDRMESLLEKLLENGVSGASGLKPPVNTTNQASISENHTASTLNGMAIDQDSSIDYCDKLNVSFHFLS